MPDCVPAATPILCADLKKAYTLVVRAGVTMLTDPYSAGWCVLYSSTQGWAEMLRAR